MKEARERVRKFIAGNALLTEGARVVVGLSGGPDSVCLARMLDSLGYEVVAVHCNFHLRGDESQRDEQFVEALCRQMGWTLHRADFDTEAYAREQKVSIEMAARQLRYERFRTLRHEVSAEAIAVGHHQDDNVETLLLNAVRGTGIRGLCGMQPRNGDVVRPLLCLTRRDILAYLQDIGQDYVTDHTNLEDDYARNKVRLDILPLLERINAGAMKNLASTQENLAEVQKVYQHALRQALAQCVEQKADVETQAGNGFLIHIPKLLSQPSPISVLHEALSPLGFNKAQLEDILAALHDCGRVFTADGSRLLIDRQHIIVEASPSSGALRFTRNASSPSLPVPVSIPAPLPVSAVTILKDPRHAYLDADKLHGPLTLRTPRQGDTFAPFGMGGRRKLLSDFLTDQKLTRFEKERQPLLMDGEEIVWVVGLRTSELYRVDATTTRVICLQTTDTDDFHG